ncbi:MAG: NADH-quinone oxidoreductase subunit A [Rickettsiales bacterium]|nr:NADH-quinone oxidoreductase subunit A [Rickettsiales bacterium]
MQDIVTGYFPILVFLGIATVLASVMTFLPMLITRAKPDNEKLSAYECGFEPFGDARGEFDVRFYLVAILFIIFDLEVAFLFPWAITLGYIGEFGFWSMMAFLGVLTIGFIYEWNKGALEWE